MEFETVFMLRAEAPRVPHANQTVGSARLTFFKVPIGDYSYETPRQ